MMINKENNYGITAAQMRPGKIFWHESGGTGLLITIDGIAYTTFLFGGDANQGVMEGGDVQFIQEITPFDVSHAMRALSRFNPGAIRHRWAKLGRRAKLPHGYQLVVGCQAGSSWPVSFFCEAIGYGGNPKDVEETTPPWRGVRAAAREALKECAKAESFEDDWHKEQSLRMEADAKARDLLDENSRLKARLISKRKARTR